MSNVYKWALAVSFCFILFKINNAYAATKDATVKDFFSTTELNYHQYKIVYTSEENVQDLLITPSKNLILICDSEFNYENTIICDANKISKIEDPAQILTTTSNVELKSILTKNQTNKFLVIPIDNFKLKELAAQNITQIRALKNLEETERKIPLVVSENKELLQNIGQIRSFFLEEGLGLLGYALILFGGILLLGKTNNFYSIKGPIKYLAPIGMFSISFMLLLIISVRDLGAIDLKYIVKFFLYTIDIKNYEVIVASPLRLLILFNIALNIGAFLWVAKNTLLDRIKELREINIKKNLNTSTTIKLTTAGAFILIVLFANTSVREYGLAETAAFLTLLFFLYLTTSNTEDKSKNKTKLASTILLTFVTGYALFINPKSSAFTNKDLIGVPHPLVYLPYLKAHTGDSFFNRLEIQDKVPIVVDNYLISHPDYKKIINKPISRFTKEGSYIIQSTPANHDYGIPEIEEEHYEDTEELVHYFHNEEMPEISFTKNTEGIVEISQFLNELQKRRLLREPFVLGSYSNVNPIIKLAL